MKEKLLGLCNVPLGAHWPFLSCNPCGTASPHGARVCAAWRGAGMGFGCGMAQEERGSFLIFLFPELLAQLDMEVLFLWQRQIDRARPSSILAVLLRSEMMNVPWQTVVSQPEGDEPRGRMSTEHHSITPGAISHPEPLPCTRPCVPGQEQGPALCCDLPPHPCGCLQTRMLLTTSCFSPDCCLHKR